MAQIRVAPNDMHTESCDKWCSHSYAGWLVSVAPDVLWFDVQDVGYYSGTVYGVGRLKKDILLFQDGYGSCSGCGAWGEGGEPCDMEDVLAHSELFQTPEFALEHVEKEWMHSYEKPDQEVVTNAINEAAAFGKVA